MLSMADMEKIFEVTDELEISREAIQVELVPAGSGLVERTKDRKIRLVLPAEGPLESWLAALGPQLTKIAPDLVGAA